MTETFDPGTFVVDPARDYYCVVGNPIAHSLSPEIHAAFAAQTGHDLTYARVLVPEGGFAAALSAFVRCGGRGMNVTVPFKAEACRTVDERSSRAALAGAVNTITVGADGRTFGDNTDGEGLVTDLRENLGITLVDARVLVVGAGGAAHGVVGPLLDAGVARLTILNRTTARAMELAANFADGRVDAGPLTRAPDGPVDLIVNATASGLSSARPDIAAGWVGPSTAGYDMVYGAGAQAFLSWASELGATLTADGLGMLVEQAAAAFALWRGVRPDTGPVIAAMRARSAH